MYMNDYMLSEYDSEGNMKMGSLFDGSGGFPLIAFMTVFVSCALIFTVEEVVMEFLISQIFLLKLMMTRLLQLLVPVVAGKQLY